MLDIFGNVFGKSKKASTNQQQTNGQAEDGTTNDTENYVFVNHNNSPYPQTTMLTDEMIRMGSSSSILHQQSPASQSTPTTSTGQAGHVYPSLDVTNGYNPHLPFSSLGAVSSRNSLATPFGSTNLTRNASPIDNVPFVISPNYGGSSSTGSGGLDDDSDVNETLSRIHQFMANPNLSEYNFKLENSILQESLLT